MQNQDRYLCGLDEEEKKLSEMVTIVLKGGERVEMRRSTTCMSKLIKMAIEDGGDEIEFEYIERSLFEYVRQYLEYHENVEPNEIPKPLTSNDLSNVLDSWDYKFVSSMDKSRSDILLVLITANYLQIESLVMLMAAKLGSIMMNKTPKEIRAEFGVTAEFTAEDEAAVREKFKDLIDGDIKMSPAVNTASTPVPTTIKPQT